MPVPHFTRSRRGVTVYFIQAGESGPIKIGMTTGESPRHRLRALQTAHYEELRLLGTITTPTSLESILHQCFEHLRIRGEWFRPESDLMEFLYKEVILFSEQTLEVFPADAISTKESCDPASDEEIPDENPAKKQAHERFILGLKSDATRGYKSKKKRRSHRRKREMSTERKSHRHSPQDPENYCPICGSRLVDNHRCDPRTLSEIDEARHED